jgi:hypothetical protein
MAMNLCGNPECRLPGRMFEADHWQGYCSGECREATHRRLLAVPCSRPTTIMRTASRPAPRPARKPTYVTEAFQQLGQEMPGDDDREADMMIRAAGLTPHGGQSALGPRRPDRTPPR